MSLRSRKPLGRFTFTIRSGKESTTVEQTLILTGTQAAAEAARLSRVQVVAAYPITPQSKIPRDSGRVCGTRASEG